MSDVDIIAIQQQAEEIARAEYKDAWDKLEVVRSELQNRDLRWREIVQRLDGHRLAPDGSPMDLDAVVNDIHVAITEYQKLNKMFTLINENPILKSQWDKLVMSIRIVGGDQA